MDIIGIVAEYNPFHLGHLHQLTSTKRLFAENVPVVAVMSGDFVQRGEAAMYSKFARAEAACKCGVDLVIELPLPWCLASAESFAHGAVELLDSLGATKLSFGSELGRIDELDKLAEILCDGNIYNEIKDLMKAQPEMSFASARELVVGKRAGELAAHLKSPNNILAVEYLKAIKGINSNIEPLTIKRVGSGHDTDGTEGPKSASEIRGMLCKGESISGFVPEEAEAVYARERRQGRELSDKTNMETAVLSRLRMLDKQAFENAADASGGLGARIFEAVRTAATLDEIYEQAKTKRYAMSRVRRVCLSTALGLNQDTSAKPVPYARVLAANEKGCALLREISDKSSVPIITKAAHIKALSSECTEVFATGAKAHDLFVLSYSQNEHKKAGQDWRTTPHIVKNR